MNTKEIYENLLKNLNTAIHKNRNEKLCKLLKDIGFKSIESDETWEYTKTDKLKDYYEKMRKKLNPFFKSNINKTIREIYSNGSSYTVLINNIVLPYLIAKISNDLDIENEYYRIDAIGYDNNKNKTDFDKELSDCNLNKYIWNLKIAVEHENKYGDWLDETIKLLQINCDCKVVIGYNKIKDFKRIKDDPNNLRETNEDHCLCVVSRIIQSLNHKKGSIAFFFGNSNQGKKAHEDLDYNGYILYLKDGNYEKL